jgi:hypothetical protein
MPTRFPESSVATNAPADEQRTIRCYSLPPLMRPATTVSLTADRLLAFEAMRLLIRIDGMLREARADWNQDRFRRLMRLRTRTAALFRRRWAKLDRPPVVVLEALRRRYHANLAGHLYPVSQD